MDLTASSGGQDKSADSSQNVAPAAAASESVGGKTVNGNNESAILSRVARFWQYAMLLFICGATLLFGLGSSRLWDRDEPRNARCTVEMLDAGNWIVPVFNDELRTHKPILLYWMQMASYQAVGQNAFGARLPSAILAFLTVWSVAIFVRRFSTDYWAFWAAVSLSTSLMFVVAGRAATPDALLISFSCFGILSAVCSFLSTSKSRRFFTAVASISFGFAILAKGPVGIVLPVFVLAVWYLVEQIAQRSSDPQPAGFVGRHVNRSRVLFQKELWKNALTDSRWYIFVGVAVLIALPWYVAVGLKTNGAWLSGFFLEHNLGRAVDTMEGHSGGIWFYPLATLLGVFPWSLIAIPVVVWSCRNFWRDDYRGSITRLGAIWWLSYVFAFSCASTKLPSYITPSYPGLCLLIGGTLLDLSTGKLQMPVWLAKTAACVCAVAGLGTVITFIAVAFQAGNVEILVLTLTGLAFVFPAAAFYFLHDAKLKTAAKVQSTDDGLEDDAGTINATTNLNSPALKSQRVNIQDKNSENEISKSKESSSNPSLLQAAFIFVGAFSRTIAAKMPSPAHAMLVPAVTVCSLVMGVGGSIIDGNRASLEMLAQVQNTASSQEPNWSALGTIEPSWVFYLDKTIEEIPLDERRAAVRTAVDRCELDDSFVIVNQQYVEDFEHELNRRDLNQIKPLTRFSRFMSSEEIVVFGTENRNDLEKMVRTAQSDSAQRQR